jgi:hypothetical protein
MVMTMFDNIDKIWEAVIAVILAVLGGLARILNLKDSKMLKWSRLFSELFVSGFAGLMILMLARTTGLYGEWVGVVCGMSGWIGPKVLDLAAKMVGKSFGVEMDNKNHKNDR